MVSGATETSPPTQPTAQGGCPVGWQALGQQCYYISFSEEEIASSWDDARDFCNQNGGDLVTILTEEENNFIQDMVDKY